MDEFRMIYLATQRRFLPLILHTRQYLNQASIPRLGHIILYS